MTPTESDWQLRLRIYEELSASGLAPSAHDLAADAGIAVGEVRQALQRLQAAHALVLHEGSGDILMAHPLSASPTDYRALLGARSLYANCAWDSLGIPAMLGANARVQARHPLNGDLVQYSVHAGQLVGGRDLLVHFALPFRQWYADIVDT